MRKAQMFPSETHMENVEHLGQYVYEMTNSKIQQLRAERGLPATEPVALVGDVDIEFGYVKGEEEDVKEEIQEGFEAEEEG